VSMTDWLMWGRWDLWLPSWTTTCRYISGYMSY